MMNKRIGLLALTLCLLSSCGEESTTAVGGEMITSHRYWPYAEGDTYTWAVQFSHSIDTVPFVVAGERLIEGKRYQMHIGEYNTFIEHPGDPLDSVVHDTTYYRLDGDRLYQFVPGIGERLDSDFRMPYDSAREEQDPAMFYRDTSEIRIGSIDHKNVRIMRNGTSNDRWIFHAPNLGIIFIAHPQGEIRLVRANINGRSYP